MDILVTHVYSGENKGDAALLSVLLSEIKRVWKDSRIVALTFETVDEGSYFENVPLENSFMHLALVGYSNKIIKFFYSLYVIKITLLYALVFRFFNCKVPLPRRIKKIVNRYHDADIIIPVGGGYLRGKKGIASTVELLLQLHPLVFASYLGKPTVLFAQSIGPFSGAFQRSVAKWALSHVTHSIVREDCTMELLRSMDITKNVTRSVDSGFLLEGNEKIKIKETLNIPKGKKLVGITVRSWLPKHKQRIYESAVAELVRSIVTEYGMEVVFIPQVTAVGYNDDDRAAADRIHTQVGELKGCHFLSKCYDHHTIKSIYDELDLVVGTRFHSVIFSLTGFVPAIAISYEHKTEGIMKDLQLGEWVIPIEDVTEEILKNLFKKLVDNEITYREYLHITIPEYRSRAKEAIAIVKEVVQKKV